MPHSFKTRRDLIDGVLDKLGVLVPGQAPSDELVSRVDELLDPVLATLAALGIVYVADAGEHNPPSLGEIDNAIYLPLTDLVAFQAAPAFNLAGDPALKVLSDQAEEILRRIGRPAQTRKTLTTDTQLQGNRRGRGTFNFTRGW